MKLGRMNWQADSYHIYDEAEAEATVLKRIATYDETHPR